MSLMYLTPGSLPSAARLFRLRRREFPKSTWLRKDTMHRIIKLIDGYGARWLLLQVLAIFASGTPAFAQAGGDRVSQFMANALSYGQSLGIYAAGFLVIWAVANVARERPSAKQWIGAGAALLLSSILQLLQSF